MGKIDMSNAELRQIPIDLIEKNPDNPRIFFRQQELDELRESIRNYGIQVPVSVFRKGKRFVLIDGERRWRCSIKLNMKLIPALVQDEPSPLQNLLLMFNIHSLREQWDYFTIANKLSVVISLIKKEKGLDPSERELSENTGLTLGQIRRCKLLIELPEKYKEDLKKELEKPKSMQRLSEDLFIEMERSLKTVQRAMPELVSDRNKNEVRNTLIQKYKTGVIGNIVDFRKMSKVARAENVESDKGVAKRALTKLFVENNYSINSAFDDSVSDKYLERDLATRIDSLLERLEEIEPEDLDSSLEEKLRKLKNRVSELLRYK